MTETLALNYGSFEPLAFDEMFGVDGGKISALEQGLWGCAAVVIAVWTPIATAALAVTGVGAPVAVAVAIIGSGAATYCYGRSTH